MLESILLLNILAVAAYSLILVIPGYLFCLIADIRRLRFLLSFGISFSLFVLWQLVCRYLDVSLNLWLVSSYVVTVTLLFCCWVYSRAHGVARPKKAVKWSLLVGAILVLGSFSCYHIFVGPYTEIPSDLYKHLSRVKAVTHSLHGGVVPHLDLSLQDLFFFSNREKYFVVPFLHAVISIKLRALPVDVIPAATLISSLIFLSSVYWFSLRLLADIKIPISYKVVAASVAVILTLLWFGVATFSYVRYYAYFASIFNFCLFFCSVALLLDYLERPRTSNFNLIAIGVFLVVMRIVHEQEMLFSLVILFGIIIWNFLKKYRSSSLENLVLRRRAKSLFATVCIFAPTAICFTFWKRDIGLIAYPHVVDVGAMFSLERAFPIANPELRFWDTLALYGFVVYVWYFFRYAWFGKISYVVVAMASPLLTLFNPIFVSWFLHVLPRGGWDVIWRFAYLMPLGIVGSFLLVFSFWNGRNHLAWRRYLLPGFGAVLLFGALSPFHTPYLFNNNSRIGSLVPVHEVAGSSLWGDLISAVQVVPGNRVIFADGVTRYVLGSVTRHYHSNKEGYEFDNEALPVTAYPTSIERLLDHPGALLVINRRNGRETGSARFSGHWAQDVLKVAKFYPPELNDFIAVNEGRFTLLWEKDHIWLYEIQPNVGSGT